jgi:hypothetical protein
VNRGGTGPTPPLNMPLYLLSFKIAHICTINSVVYIPKGLVKQHIARKDFLIKTLISANNESLVDFVKNYLKNKVYFVILYIEIINLKNAFPTKVCYWLLLLISFS